MPARRPPRLLACIRATARDRRTPRGRSAFVSCSRSRGSKSGDGASSTVTSSSSSARGSMRGSDGRRRCRVDRESSDVAAAAASGARCRAGGIEQEVVGDEPIGLGFRGDVVVERRSNIEASGRRRVSSARSWCSASSSSALGGDVVAASAGQPGRRVGRSAGRRVGRSAGRLVGRRQRPLRQVDGRAPA